MYNVLNFKLVWSVSDKLPFQKFNYLTEDKICEYVTNYELGYEVSIFDLSESVDNLFNLIYIFFYQLVIISVENCA